MGLEQYDLNDEARAAILEAQKIAGLGGYEFVKSSHLVIPIVESGGYGLQIMQAAVKHDAANFSELMRRLQITRKAIGPAQANPQFSRGFNDSIRHAEIVQRVFERERIDTGLLLLGVAYSHSHLGAQILEECGFKSDTLERLLPEMYERFEKEPERN